MNRSRLAILGTVSAFTLLAGTASGAVMTAPIMNLGLLKPHDAWKVGTVDAAGFSYCAMVGKFDKQVVLAFARNPDGYGSIAMDFREGFFEPGSDYEVTLRPDSGKVRTLSAHASSDRSIVVQVGQDEAFFQGLQSNGDLDIGLPTINASFALRQFSKAYNNLVDCAGKVSGKGEAFSPPAVKVKAVESDTLTPLDEEVAKISDGDKSAPVKTAKADSFKDMDSQLDREAAAEATESGKKLAALESRKQELEQKIAEHKTEAAAIAQQPAAASAERKLLASTDGADAPVALTAATVTTAQQLEQQQLAEARKLRAAEDEKKTAALRLAVENKQKEVAALETARASAAEENASAAGKKVAELQQQQASTEKARDALMAQLQQYQQRDQDDKALKANLLTKQAQITALNQQSAAQAEEASQKIALTQKDYETRIAAAQTARDALKKQLDAALGTNVALAGEAAEAKKAATDSAEKAVEVQAELAVSEREKKDLLARIETADRQNKLLQVALGDKEKTVAAAQGNGKALATVQAQLSDIQKRHASEMAKLEDALAGKTAQYDALQKQFDGLKTADAAQSTESKGLIARLQQKLAEMEASRKADAERNAKLASNQAAVANLEAQLKTVEAAREAEAGRAAQAQADLQSARAQIAALQDGLARAKAATASAPAPAKISDLLPSERAELEEYRRNARATIANVQQEQAPAAIPQRKPAVAEAAGDLTVPPFLAALAVPAVEAAPAAAEAPAVAVRRPIAQIGERGLQTADAMPAPKYSAGNSAVSAVGAVKLLAETPRAQATLADIAPAAGTPDKVISAPAAIKTPTVAAVRTPARPAVKTPVTPTLSATVTPTLSATVTPTESAAVTPTASAAQTAPAAPASSGIEWNPAPHGYNMHAPEKPAAQPAATSDSADNFPMPAVPQEPVVAQPAAPAAAPAASAAPNRAAAFLDKIMAYHRADAVAEDIADAAPIASPLPTLAAADKVEPPAAAPRVKIAAARKVQDIEPASGTPSPEPSLSAEAAAPVKAVSRDAVIAAEQAAEDIPAVMSSNTDKLPLEKILSGAGLARITYTPVAAAEGETIRQWTTGKINGMLEQTAAAGSFKTQIEGYLGRYRDDCPGHLTANVGRAQMTQAGQVAVAAVSCNIASNAYTTSFVFLREGDAFTSILHSGTPSDAAAVKDTGARIAAALKASGGIALGADAPAKSASADVPQLKVNEAAPQLKFNIVPSLPVQDTSVGYTQPGDDIQTTIIQ